MACNEGQGVKCECVRENCSADKFVWWYKGWREFSANVCASITWHGTCFKGYLQWHVMRGRARNVCVIQRVAFVAVCMCMLQSKDMYSQSLGGEGHMIGISACARVCASLYEYAHLFS